MRKSLLLLLGAFLVLSADYSWAQQMGGRMARGGDQGAPDPADLIRVRSFTALGSRAVVASPFFQTSMGRGVKPQQEWHVVTMEYDTAPDWLDEMLVQYYVMSMMQDRETRSNRYSLYRKTVRYVDIEQGRGHIARAFLRPAAVKRFGDVVAAAAVLTIDGQEASVRSDESVELPERWWENPLVLDSEALTVRDGYLLDRMETPWAVINVDDYEFIR